MGQPTILIVEDDPFTRDLLARCFAKEGYLVDQAATGRQMHEKLEHRKPTLILLDRALPDEDGLVLLRQLRRHSDVPVVMLSAYADDADRIAGLAIGADDYVSKFWKTEELIARVSAVVRRYRPTEADSNAARRRYLTFAGFTLDTEGHALSDSSGRNIVLTPAEFRLLCALALAKGRTLSRDMLLDALGHGADAPQDRTVDVHISHLRTKLGCAGKPADQRIIRTITNVGYQMADC
ncbi:MAG: response regulator transcription factor [Rhodospirillales bacterium]|nr:response regulator transcription factor [Rhodospirillales bacterium]